MESQRCHLKNCKTNNDKHLLKNKKKKKTKQKRRTRIERYTSKLNKIQTIFFYDLFRCLRLLSPRAHTYICSSYFDYFISFYSLYDLFGRWFCVFWVRSSDVSFGLHLVRFLCLAYDLFVLYTGRHLAVLVGIFFLCHIMLPFCICAYKSLVHLLCSSLFLFLFSDKQTPYLCRVNRVFEYCTLPCRLLFCFFSLSLLSSVVLVWLFRPEHVLRRITIKYC